MPVAALCVAVHTGWAFRPKRGDGHWASRWAWCKTCRASTGPQKHGAERRSGRCAWRFPESTQEFEFDRVASFKIPPLFSTSATFFPVRVYGSLFFLCGIALGIYMGYQDAV